MLAVLPFLESPILVGRCEVCLDRFIFRVHFCGFFQNFDSLGEGTGL